MKSKMLLALAGLLIVSMLVVSPVSAQSVIYRAYGTLDNYSAEWYDETRATIYRGFWRIRIEDDEVTFRAAYLEKNIEEENPGTLDWFRLRLTDASVLYINDGECIVEGTLVFYKIGWDPYGLGLPGYKDLPGPFYRAVIPIDVTIRIDPDKIKIEMPGTPNEGIVGSTLFVDY